MIVRDGKHIFKIIDFGSMTEVYSINSTAGTPSYLAPERFEQASISESTELFAIGITLYESLTGKFPYGEIEPFQNPTFKIPKEPKKFNNNIPLWLESIILRATSVDTKLRYNNYSEMVFELDNSEKVKPFFRKDIPFLERNPLRTFQLAFYLMVILNFYLISR